MFMGLGSLFLLVGCDFQCGDLNLTKRLRRIRNAWHFWFALDLVFTAQWFGVGGLRCSPLNAALCC